MLDRGERTFGQFKTWLTVQLSVAKVFDATNATLQPIRGNVIASFPIVDALAKRTPRSLFSADDMTAFYACIRIQDENAHKDRPASNERRLPTETAMSTGPVYDTVGDRLNIRPRPTQLHIPRSVYP